MAIIQKKEIFEGFDEPNRRRLAAIFLGYHAENPKHCFSMEKTVGYHKKFDFSFKHAERADFCAQKSAWVTQGVPFLPYVLAGFVFQVLFGDALLNLMR
jgi:preflagellin peptidase FlaK